MTRTLTDLWDQLDTYDRERCQLIQLRHYLSNKVLPFSSHYGKLFKKIGVAPDDIRSFEDWSQIPFTTKADLLPREDGSPRSQDFVLQNSISPKLHSSKTPSQEFRPIMMTSTAGRDTEPVPFLYTKHDIRNLEKAGSRIMLFAGSGQEFRHLNLFPYASQLAFWQAHYSSLGHDIFMASSGGGMVNGISGNVEIATQIKPDVLIGAPTFIYHVLQVAIETGQRLANLKKIILGGEKVPPGLRQKLRGLARELGARDISIISTYGFAEAKMAFPECPIPENAEDGSSFHLFPDLGIVEIVNPETGAILGENEPGEIVFTSLDSRGTVVLRYRTGDHIEHGITYERCEYCGRRLPRLLGKISRVSEIREVSASLVNFNELESCLDDLTDVGAWQIELRNRNDDPGQVDELLVHLSTRVDVDRDALTAAIAERFLSIADLKPSEIRFHSPSKMRERHGVGLELKEKRFLDRRVKVKR